MPTKTLPKELKWDDGSFKPIVISESDFDLLIDNAGIDAHLEPDRAAQFKSGIQALLVRCARILARRRDRPLPAHVMAALRPIQHHASELAALIQPDRLPLEAQHALDLPAMDDGSAYDLLRRLDMACQTAIAHLGQSAGPGKHIQRRAEGHAIVREQLLAFFMQYRGEPPSAASASQESGAALLADADDDASEYAGARTEFVEICERYIQAALA